MAIAPDANLGDDQLALQNLPWNYGTSQWHREFNERYGAHNLDRYLASLGIHRAPGSRAERLAARQQVGNQSGLPRTMPNGASNMSGAAGPVGSPSTWPLGYHPSGGRYTTTQLGAPVDFAWLSANTTAPSAYTPQILAQGAGYTSAVPEGTPRLTPQAMRERYNMAREMFGLQMDEFQAQSTLARIQQDQERQAALDQLRLIEQGNAMNFNWGPYQALQMIVGRR